MTAAELFTASAGQLHAWRLHNPHAFIGALITIAHVGDDVHLQVRKDIDDVLGSMTFEKPETSAIIRAKLLDRMNDGVCPVLIFTQDREAHVSSYAWVAPYLVPPRPDTAS